ncbi:T9SS type A sorting domain-containing protein [Flavobacterium sedimenticola]|uniref:T9SS type A sorting domain-containing protein n=1 Tax=Flavobacterium sedimenticola TaxID=3043286 RepID=A0ABT6XM08_9FLAO|nr:T9SS type A sorting domain-containing protein [Flavobacterium sedimenticola]MDI9256122.1 T9SS type A sorting domain-containing protein [Flavobacterium sedimenticola]
MKKLLLSISFLSLGFAANAQSWTSQATGFNIASRGIEEINIVDANTVWGLAYDGSGAGATIQEFTLTTDGGATWTPGTINVGDPALGINNISPISATTAWVSAVNGTDGTGSVIFKTSDGGANWDQQNIGGFTNASSFVNYVHFFDANNGMAAGDPINGEFEIYTTNDGGDNWTLVPGANIPNPLSGEYGYNGGNSAIGSTVWLVTNKGRILKSSDMGLTWSVAQAPLTDFGGTAQSGRLIFSDLNNGALLKIAGTTYTFYTTTNGGTTWSAGTPFTGTYRLLSYIPGTTTIVATGAGTTTGGTGSAYSSNNGTSWTSIDSGAQRGVSAFFNGTTGWCAGFNTDPFTDGIFKLNGTLANDSFNATSFKVYPNPANNFVTIATEGLDSYNLRVTDLSGKVMMAKELTGIENTVDVSSYAAGVYFFEVNSGSKSETIKIIKN